MRRLELVDPARHRRPAELPANKLGHLIVGQEEAIPQIMRAYQSHFAGLSPAGRPVGNFLFLGPDSSGKTRVVEKIAEALLKNSQAVIKIDCAEFQHSHEIAQLSQEALNQQHTETVKLSFVLFEEIENASDALWKLLLGILDKATLTLGDNRRVDFSSTIVFLTSDLGAAELSSLMSPRLSHLKLSARISNAGIAAARRKFTPEFIDRLDNIVVSKAPGRVEPRRIVTGFANLLTGARYLKHAIVKPLSKRLPTGSIHHGDSLRVLRLAGRAA